MALRPLSLGEENMLQQPLNFVPQVWEKRNRQECSRIPPTKMYDTGMDMENLKTSVINRTL